MIQVREAVADDIPSILNLIKELALYEKAPEQVINSEEQMLNDGFGEHPLFKAFVAEKENQVIGTAICYTAYSTWKGKYIYLDDIVVTASERKTGAGTLLFEAILNFAINVKANQLRWHVLDWNEPAISFYKKYPCTFDEEWITCKIEKEQLLK